MLSEQCWSVIGNVTLPINTKFEQLNLPELMLPIKLLQFKICELAVTNDTLNQAQASRSMLCEQYWSALPFNTNQFV